MTPIVHGTMLAEARYIGQHNERLNLLFIGEVTDDVKPFLNIQLELLRNYLNEIGSRASINLYCVNGNVKQFDPSCRDTAITELDYSLIRDYALENDIDLLVDLNALLLCDETRAYNVEFGYVSNTTELYAECEAFLAGRGIAWNLPDPIWHETWFHIFFRRDGLAKIAMDFLGTCQSNGRYSSEQIDKVRHLTNKIGQIEYSRYILKYFLQLKRRERRITQSQHVMSFELNYHLGAYYFYISGTFDVLARLLCSVFDMGNMPYKHLAIEKLEFTNQLSSKNTELAHLYVADEFNKWLVWLKKRRNYIAHEAHIAISSIVKAPEKPMPEEEISKLVDNEMDWQYMAAFLPPDILESQRRLVAELIRIKELEVELEDAMLVKDKNNTVIFLPLNSLDHDFAQMSNIIKETVEILDRLQTI